MPWCVVYSSALVCCAALCSALRCTYPPTYPPIQLPISTHPTPPLPSPPPQYVKWVNTNDPVQMWQAEAACAKYEYSMNNDMFKGEWWLVDDG